MKHQAEQRRAEVPPEKRVEEQRVMMVAEILVESLPREVSVCLVPGEGGRLATPRVGGVGGGTAPDTALIRGRGVGAKFP